MPSVNVTGTVSGTVLAAPTNGFIRILGYQITSQGNPGRVTLQSGSTVLAGVSAFASNGGGIACTPVAVNGSPYADVAAGYPLTWVQTTGGVTVDINVQYCYVGNYAF